MNNLAKGDTVTLRGVVIPGVQGSIQGDSSTASFVGTTRFGYVDYFKNGTIGTNVNAYSETATTMSTTITALHSKTAFTI